MCNQKNTYTLEIITDSWPRRTTEIDGFKSHDDAVQAGVETLKRDPIGRTWSRFVVHEIRHCSNPFCEGA